MYRKIAIAVATLALTYAAWANSATTLFSKFAPEQGLRLDPTSAQALINVTEKASTQKDKTAFRKIARRNAIAALRSEPLASRAIRQLGLYYDVTGNRAEARKLVRLANSLSRRDPTAQLWLADDYLRAGRYRQAMAAIDVVLRTEPDTRETVSRVLGATLADPAFRQVFVSYVKNRPSWLSYFIDYNVATMQQPQWLSQALIELQPLPPAILSDTSSAVLLTALVNRAPIEEARRFYLTFPKADTRALESLSYRGPAVGLLFPPVGWELMNDGNVQGFGDSEGNSIAIEAIAAPGRRGPAARKLLFLRPGSYRWIGNADLAGLGPGAAAGVSILCNDGPGIWTPLLRREASEGQNSFDFSIVSACSAQMLVIDIIGSENQSDSNIKFSKMRVLPLRNDKTATKSAAAAPSDQ